LETAERHLIEEPSTTSAAWPVRQAELILSPLTSRVARLAGSAAAPPPLQDQQQNRYEHEVEKSESEHVQRPSVEDDEDTDPDGTGETPQHLAAPLCFHRPNYLCSFHSARPTDDTET
jgi:hypothetical protein